MCATRKLRVAEHAEAGPAELAGGHHGGRAGQPAWLGEAGIEGRRPDALDLPESLEPASQRRRRAVSLRRPGHDQQIQCVGHRLGSLVGGRQLGGSEPVEPLGDHLRDVLGVAELGVIDHQDVHVFTPAMRVCR